MGKGVGWPAGWLWLLGLLLGLSGCQPLAEPETPSADQPLFCFWNVENLFDDQQDRRTGPGDEEYDRWFSQDPQALKLKLARLVEALLQMNGGKGPDILAVVEVESMRAADLLRQALNQRLADSAWHYQHVLMKEISGGRHISPAIITRLPVLGNRTRAHGNRLRILEGHLVVDGHELVVIASHWSSRLRPGSDQSRAAYADKIYGAVNAMFKNNPLVDVLVCGDFNDSPADKSVAHHLRATTDLAAVRSGQELRLFHLMGDKDPAQGFGTHYYRKWFIFDQMVVSPGMLDQSGWSCQPASVQTINALNKPGDPLRRPWRFGAEKDSGPRGYSDHFPVTVRLRLHRQPS